MEQQKSPYRGYRQIQSSTDSRVYYKLRWSSRNLYVRATGRYRAVETVGFTTSRDGVAEICIQGLQVDTEQQRLQSSLTHSIRCGCYAEGISVLPQVTATKARPHLNAKGVYYILTYWTRQACEILRVLQVEIESQKPVYSSYRQRQSSRDCRVHYRQRQGSRDQYIQGLQVEAEQQRLQDGLQVEIEQQRQQGALQVEIEQQRSVYIGARGRDGVVETVEFTTGRDRAAEISRMHFKGFFLHNIQMSTLISKDSIKTNKQTCQDLSAFCRCLIQVSFYCFLCVFFSSVECGLCY